LISARYSLDRTAEQERLCNSIEANILLRSPYPRQVVLNLARNILKQEGRWSRWANIAKARRYRLSISDWVQDEIIESAH
jgi:hypothetical protein